MEKSLFYSILCFGFVVFCRRVGCETNINAKVIGNSIGRSQLNNDILLSHDATDISVPTENGSVKQRQINLHNQKPLKNIFMGIYQNYRSTFLGNRTSSQYKKFAQEISTMLPESSASKYLTKSQSAEPKRKKNKNNKVIKGLVSKKQEALLYSYDGEYRYNLGPGVNISLDMNRDIVSVNLDEDCLKEIFYGKWNDDSSGRGRGKKHQMITKILPLFILPFLIQSAIIPFLVAKLKLLLIKSILVGKLAIFLLIISAIKNNQKNQTYEPAPAYWASEPSRRSEIVSGYRVEGRPTNWVN